MMKKTVLYIALVGLSVFILTFLFPEQNIVDNVIEEGNLTVQPTSNSENSQNFEEPRIISQQLDNLESVQESTESEKSDVAPTILNDDSTKILNDDKNVDTSNIVSDSALDNNSSGSNSTSNLINNENVAAESEMHTIMQPIVKEEGVFWSGGVANGNNLGNSSTSQENIDLQSKLEPIVKEDSVGNKVSDITSENIKGDTKETYSK